MPELPEVEIVRESLNKKIRQKKVENVIVRNRKLRFKIPLNFENFLRYQKILEVSRFSKYLIFKLSNKSFCLLHLGMSGTIHLLCSRKKNLVTNTSFYSSPTLPEKHNHVEIIFKNLRLVYNDPRRFGFFQILKDENSLKKKFLSLGPEPFDRKFDKKYIYSSLRNKVKNIKNFLLDQNFVSGIGNIYANEILFLSKIRPTQKGATLTEKDCKKIAKNSQKVLRDAIDKGGSSIRDFKNTLGKKGNFQKKFNVYGRNGLNCKRLRCQGIIKKKVISNRSTFYCSTCQK